MSSELKYDAEVGEFLDVFTEFMNSKSPEMVDDLVDNLDIKIDEVFTKGFRLGVEVGRMLKNKDK